MCDIHLAHAVHFYPDRIQELYPHIAQLSDLGEQVEALSQHLSDPNLRELRQSAKVQYYSMIYELHA